MIKLVDILRWTQGQWVNRNHCPDVNADTFAVEGIGSDTRKDLSQKVFIPLAGENFDGHDFLNQAVSQGAKAILAHRIPGGFQCSIPVILVKDTLEALQDLAHGYRKTLRAEIVGITGSNGKTSTKEFAAALLQKEKRTHWNEGSFNNHWGVPFNLLGVNQDTEVVLVEMGMNHLGEIQRLAEIAEPSVVVCTMVGTAHIENLGSVEKIAEAKSEIYRFSPQAKKIFNLDQEWTLQMRKQFSKSGDLSFSEKDPKADVFLQITEMNESSLKVRGHIHGVSGEALVPIFGKQNLTNLLAAAGIASLCGVGPERIWRNFALCKTTWGRNQFLPLKNGGRVLFDAYNANPDSMTALLENLELMKGSSLLGIFGQMRELGEFSREAHRQLGESAGRGRFESIFFIGDDKDSFLEGFQSSGSKAFVAVEKDWSPQIQSLFESHLRPSHLVTMKASRGTRLERFLPAHLLDPQYLKKP